MANSACPMQKDYKVSLSEERCFVICINLLAFTHEMRKNYLVELGLFIKELF